MNINPSELDKDYLLLDTLNHKELIPFVRKYQKWKYPSTKQYVICNLIFLTLIIIASVIYSNDPTFKFERGFSYLSYGLLASLLLVPLHELIHAWAYKIKGAPVTSYDSNLKKFYFMAMADQFVASRSEFRFVALAPFVLITLFGIIALIFIPIYWKFMCMGILLAHTSFCAGDFALLSYFEEHNDKEVVTYDSKEQGMSYFYYKATDAD